MRLLLVLFGTLTIIAYAGFGAILMNNWAVTAASGFPLEPTMTDMAAAGEPYSAIPGYFYFTIGVLLAITWASLALKRSAPLAGSAALAIWAGVLTPAAPAYFMFSTRNLMSVGDTYWEWNGEAAFALSQPLNIISVIAAVVTVVALVIYVIQDNRRAQ